MPISKPNFNALGACRFSVDKIFAKTRDTPEPIFGDDAAIIAGD